MMVLENHTLDGSLECLKKRNDGFFWKCIWTARSDINVPKILQPKGLFFVRPSMQQYLTTREELDEASKILFEKIKFWKS